VLCFTLTGEELFGTIKLYSRLVVAIRDTLPVMPDVDGDPLKAFALAVAARMLDKNPDRRPPLDEILDQLDGHTSALV
jgi:hypothetical protein